MKLKQNLTAMLLAFFTFVAAVGIISCTEENNPENIKCTVVFELNGGALPAGVENPATYTAMDTVVLPIPTKEGYAFGGWYDNAGYNGGVVTQIAQGSTGNMVFYAKWNYEYTIMFALNDGVMSADAENPMTYTAETETFVLPTPTKENYVFAGWYDNARYNGGVVTQITKGSTGNKTFYAKWNLPYTLTEYSITFGLHGGALPAGVEYPMTYTTAETVTLPIPTKKGYDFAGWYENAECTGEAVWQIVKGSTGDRKFYAKWMLPTYSVTFELNGGELPVGVENPMKYTAGTATFALPKPSKENYDFDGWYDNAECTGDAVSQVTNGSTGNKTFYAKWEIWGSLTEAEAATKIKNLTGAGPYRIKVTGTLSPTLTKDSMLVEALNALQESHPSSRVELDLSGTTGMTSIEDKAFLDCNALESVTIPNGVTSIGVAAFSGCGALKSVAIPDSVTSIGASAFYRCRALESVKIPDGVTSIANGMFYWCDSLRSVTIPDSVESIEGWAFYECNYLKNVKIPDGVTSIGGEAFIDCWGIENLTIPSSVTKIGYRAFGHCYNLARVNVEATTPPEMECKDSKYNQFEHCAESLIIYVPKDSETLYEETAGWNRYVSKIQSITE